MFVAMFKLKRSTFSYIRKELLFVPSSSGNFKPQPLLTHIIQPPLYVLAINIFSTAISK